MASGAHSKVTDNDQVGGPLSAKLTSTGNTITFTTVNPGVNETLNMEAAVATSLSVIAAQALDGTFTPGTHWNITDASLNEANILLTADINGFLQGYGWGNYQNAVMGASVRCFIWYNLATDIINAIYEPVQNNYFSQQALFGISSFPFDLVTVNDNNITDASITFTGGNTFNGNVIGKYATVSLANNSTMVDNTLLQNAIVNLGSVSACTLDNCEIKGGTQVTLTDNHTFSKCVVGAGKIIDCTNIANGYNQTNKIYEGDKSTFVITSTDNASVNPDGTETINMIDFPWAGILKPDNGVNNLATFSGFPTDHSWSVYPIGTDLSVEDFGVGAGNIYLKISGTSAALKFANGDFMEFQAWVQDSSKVQEINSYVV